jgi:hypothetical protein
MSDDKDKARKKEAKAAAKIEKARAKAEKARAEAAEATSGRAAGAGSAPAEESSFRAGLLRFVKEGAFQTIVKIVAGLVVGYLLIRFGLR